MIGLKFKLQLLVLLITQLQWTPPEPQYTSLNQRIEDRSIVNLPPSIGFSGSYEHSYCILWTHENGFNVIGQYNNKKLIGGFVLYSGSFPVEPGQKLNIHEDLRFVRVGTAPYHNRLLHILCPILVDDLDKTEKIYYAVQEDIARFYRGF